MLRSEGPEAFAEHFCRASARPFVEVPDHQSRARLILTQHLCAEEPLSLCLPLSMSRSEMHVEDMQDSIRANVDICLQHPALFPSFVRHIMILPALEPKSCERHVAVVAAIQGTVRSKAHRIIIQS